MLPSFLPLQQLACESFLEFCLPPLAEHPTATLPADAVRLTWFVPDVAEILTAP